MKEFRDNEGRPWMLALTCASAARVKDLVTIEITEDVEQPDGTVKEERRAVPFDIINTAKIHKTLEVLRTQYGTIAEVAYAMVLRQVEEKGLSKEQFLDGLKGNSLDSAAKAIEEELIDFFPQRLRPVVTLMAQKMDEVWAKSHDEAKASLEAVVTVTSGASSGRPLASSASTLANGHSDNSLPLATPA